MSPELGKWSRIIASDPDHSNRFVSRFRQMAMEGRDIVGEARTINAMVAPHSHVLDAGCGSGRHAGHLHELGHTVVGVDVDPVLLAAAEEDHPGPTYVTQDLAELDLPALGVAKSFDAILCAGNVMTFLHPNTRVESLARMREHLAPEGRAAIGFAAGRGYEFADFLHDANDAGLELENAFSTWNLRPFRRDSTFLVAFLTPEGPGRGEPEPRVVTLGQR